MATTAKALVDAAYAVNRPLLKKMLDAGADPNRGFRLYKPLHALIQPDPHKASDAPEAERFACAELLLQHGADVEGQSGWPPLRALVLAAFCGARPWVDWLFERGAKRDFFSDVALGETAAVKKAVAKDRALANARDAGNLPALSIAAGSRISPIAVMKALIDAGADVRATTAFHDDALDAAYFACGADRGDALSMLLEHGAIAEGALSCAAWKKTDDLCEIALRRGADVNRARIGPRPLLNEMIRWGRMDRVFWLLKHRADPNIPDGEGWTAVHQAASRGNARMMKAVLDAGGDAKRADKKGKTPRQVAALRGYGKLVEMM